jgi:2-polyprenyl-6-methoxyphenol hydroxylase-like FAD-dependent oxidoreductase
MAGLLATRVLSDHFGRVTLVERDSNAAERDPRKGVPQGRHVHALLSRGEHILGQLFPDLVAALEAAGAVRVDMGNDVSWYHFDVWKTRFFSGVSGLLFSRPLLEWHISRRVAALPNVDVIDDCDVHGFTADADRTRVTGITIQRHHGDMRQETLNADLVIDASGRGSQTPLWLASLGYMQPEESTLKIGVGYATRLYRRPEKFVGWKALVVAPRPP